MKKLKDAGRPLGTKKTQDTAAAARDLLEQGRHWPRVVRIVNSKFGTDLTVGALKKQIQRNYPTLQKKLRH